MGVDVVPFEDDVFRRGSLLLRRLLDDDTVEGVIPSEDDFMCCRILELRLSGGTIAAVTRDIFVRCRVSITFTFVASFQKYFQNLRKRNGDQKFGIRLYLNEVSRGPSSAI